MPTFLESLTAHTPLPLLGPHLPTFIVSAIGFYLVQIATHRLAPQLRWTKKAWEGWDERTRRGFASHVVSMIHALVAIPLAAKSLQSTILANDPVFGYDAFVGHALAFSSGYFLWDTVDSLLNSTIGFVVHGAACLAVYMFSFRPFLAGFGPPFLLWELSTPLLNIHLVMDKMNLSTTYPTFFLINALAFMGVFFLARICYGGYNTMWHERHRIPLHLHLIYCTGNIALNALNWLWFSKMLSKMLARLSGEEKPKPTRGGKRRSSAAVAAGPANGNEKQPLLEKSPDQSGDEQVDEAKEDLGSPADPPRPSRSKGSRVERL